MQITALLERCKQYHAQQSKLAKEYIYLGGASLIFLYCFVNETFFFKKKGEIQVSRGQLL
jgi:hypothetical protein